MSRIKKNPRSLIDYHKRLENDLEYFAKNAPLIIKDKAGKLIPFEFNFVQRKIHNALEQQRKEKGWVRALIVKPRQPGCSTYVQARFYQKATRQEGTNVFILTHEAQASENIYNMVERYHNNCREEIRPHAEVSNRKRLAFTGLESQFTVATAGNKGAGRSATTKLFHGSEVAFWENTDDISTGAMQTVPLLPNTEIILESTANGLGNMFWEMCRDARHSLGDYIVIFIAWFEHPEYTRDVPQDFQLTQEEAELKDLYKLSDGQVAWRRAKIAELKSAWKFKQEYPANIDEAFQTSGDSFISIESIVKARQSKVKDPIAPLIMGVDPASVNDRAVIAFRRGREIPKVYSFDTKEQPIEPMEFVGKVSQLLQKHKPQQCFIDIGEGGRAIVDRLHELGFEDSVTGVSFGSTPLDPDQYLNKRAEMWCEMRDWLKDDVSIPDEDDIQADLCMMPQYKITSSSRIQMVPKEQLREKYKMSPDIGDAIALTFAFPVNSEKLNKKVENQAEGVKTLRRWRSKDGSSGSSS